MDINKATKEIHTNAVEHGWWNSERNFTEVIALCHSELSEALEEDRVGKPLEYFVRNGKDETDMSKWNGEKTEGAAVEMADCIIRILDWCGSQGIDIGEVIKRKHEYNKTRPYKHGKKY